MFAGGTLYLFSFVLLLFCVINSQQTVYTHSQALQLLNEAGIEVTSSGQCSDRGNPQCTSLEGIHSEAIDGIITVKRASLCPMVIIGATERGHRRRAVRRHSNSNHRGNVLWTIDIRKNAEDCIKNYMYNFHKTSENRWRVSANIIFVDRHNHWTIHYGNNGQNTPIVLLEPYLNYTIRRPEDRPENSTTLLVVTAISFIPPEVMNFYNELTEEEKSRLEELMDRRFQSENELLDFLKVKSEKLYNKAIEIRALTYAKFNALTDGAKGFVIQLLRNIQQLKPLPGEKTIFGDFLNKAEIFIERYNELDEEDQESLKNKFSMIAGIIQNEKFQEFAKTLAKEWRHLHQMTK